MEPFLNISNTEDSQWCNHNVGEVLHEAWDQAPNKLCSAFSVFPASFLGDSISRLPSRVLLLRWFILHVVLRATWSQMRTVKSTAIKPKVVVAHISVLKHVSSLCHSYLKFVIKIIAVSFGFDKGHLNNFSNSLHFLFWSFSCLFFPFMFSLLPYLSDGKEQSWPNVSLFTSCHPLPTV